MLEMKAKVIGDVQGVGFRTKTRALALKLGLTGYVANCNDGSVEIVAQGAKKDLEGLITALKEHFGHRYIQHVITEFHTAKELFEQFSIKTH